jgi:hypothetical protein
MVSRDDDTVDPLFNEIELDPQPVQPDTLHWSATETLKAVWSWTNPSSLASSEERTVLGNIVVAIVASAFVMLLGVLREIFSLSHVNHLRLNSPEKVIAISCHGHQLARRASRNCSTRAAALSREPSSRCAYRRFDVPTSA